MKHPFTIVQSLTILLVMFVTVETHAQDKYHTAMLKNIDALYKAGTLAEYQVAVNSFERIAAAEKNKFEPFYYIAFGEIMMANTEADGAKKDAHLDLAVSAINKAKALKPNDSEVVALEGFVHMIRVTVDPQSRGQEYSAKAFNSFNTAVALDPNNPRALALLGQMQLGTARFFGSDTHEACATFSSAAQKFASFQSTDALAPQWGRAMVEQAKANCK